jgi:hypothetical protein
MKKIRGPANRGKGKIHLLSHYLYCNHCGIMYSGWIQNHKKGYHYVYYSHRYKNNKKQSVIESKLLSAIDIKIQKFRYNDRYTEFLKKELSNITKKEKIFRKMKGINSIKK